MGFCEKCGKEIAEGEQCACSVISEEAVQETKPAMDKNKMMIIGAVAAAVVVFILLIAAIAGGSKGYMEPVDDFMKQINKRNTDPVEVYGTLMPDFAASLFADCHKQYSVIEEYLDSYEDSVDTLEDYYDDCDDEFEKWKIRFEEKKATKLDEDELEEIQDYLDDYYDDNYLDEQVDYLEDILDDADELEDLADEADISKGKVKSILKSSLKYVEAYEELKVTAGYEVKGKFIVKSGKDEYDTETVEFIVVKINGDWTYWGLSSGSLSIDDDDENCFDFLSTFLRSKKLYRSIY